MVRFRERVCWQLEEVLFYIILKMKKTPPNPIQSWKVFSLARSTAVFLNQLVQPKYNYSNNMVAILLCRLGWASILYLTLCYCFRQTFSFKCKLAIFGFNQSVLSKHVKKIHVASWLWKWELYTCLNSFVEEQLWKKIALSY